MVGIEMTRRSEIDWKLCKGARNSGLCKPNKFNLFPCQSACQRKHGVSCIQFSSNNNPYTCMQCAVKHPPCLHYSRFENIPLQKFMSKNFSTGIWALLCVTDAIEIDEGIKINSENCAGCLLCATYCPISAISFDTRIRAHLCHPSTCSKPCIEKCPVSAIRVVNYFDAEKFELLKNSSARTRWENLAALTSLSSLNFVSFLESLANPLALLFRVLRDKDKLIPWAGNVLRKIFQINYQNVVGYEIPVKEGFRPMRLELAIRDGIPRFFFFTKFKHDVKDFRFIDKHLQARRAVERYFSSIRKKISYSDFLVIGCSEDEILHKGIIKSSLLSRLEKYDLPLVSLQALYVLLALSLFAQKKVPFTVLYNFILSKERKLYVLSSNKSFKRAIQSILSCR